MGLDVQTNYELKEKKKRIERWHISTLFFVFSSSCAKPTKSFTPALILSEFVKSSPVICESRSIPPRKFLISIFESDSCEAGLFSGALTH
jgi:hypothetical protein